MSDADTDRIVTGDSMDVLDEMPENSVHAVVTDPPYGLAFMGRDWDDFEPKEYQEWCERWASKALRVLKPGGHLLAFSGNRTHHRLFSGVEDAGFEVRDTVTWHYGSGFPKALDVSKAIDKQARKDFVDQLSVDILNRAGVPDPEKTYYDWTEDSHVPSDKHWRTLKEGIKNSESLKREIISKGRSGETAIMQGIGDKNNAGGKFDITAPATDAAAEWDGWKTTLKPATEFVVVARAPLSEGTVAENVQTHGTGALNIDGTRIETDGRPSRTPSNDNDADIWGETSNLWNGGAADGTTTEGRYPSNVVFDEEAADETAERYFYTSKATRAERTLDGKIDNAHPTVKPSDLMEWLVRLVTAEGQVVLDPFAGTGTTCRAAKDLGRAFIGVEKDPKWADVARVRCGLTPNDPSTVREDGTVGLEDFA